MTMTSQPGRVGGPSYPLLLRALAVLAVLALGWQAQRTLHAQPALSLERETLWLAGLSAAIALAGLWHMLNARTAIDATHVTQSGLWTRTLALSEVRRVDILHPPGLAWLIAPRARLHTAGRGSYVFHASDPQVLERFWLLALGEQVST
jgi:hypothetical protein